MGVIVSIVAVVLLVLLYDFFSARRWQLVTSSIRNNIVFENRNKAYGAYVLRSSYDKRMVIVMASVFFFIGATFGIYTYIKNMPEEVLEEPKIMTENFTMPAEPVEEVPPPPEETPPPPTEETVAFNPPIIVDIPVDDEVPPQEAMEDTKASDKTQEGTDDFAPPAVGTDEGPKVVDEPKKEEEILEFVQEEASFLGGNIQAWINQNVVYPEVSRELGEQGRVFVEFVVETDGSISNVRVAKSVSEDLDKEAVRVIRKMPRWNPAKNNGKTVRSRVRLPINFTLAG